MVQREVVTEMNVISGGQKQKVFSFFHYLKLQPVILMNLSLDLEHAGLRYRITCVLTSDQDQNKTIDYLISVRTKAIRLSTIDQNFMQKLRPDNLFMDTIGFIYELCGQNKEKNKEQKSANANTKHGNSDRRKFHQPRTNHIMHYFGHKQIFLTVRFTFWFQLYLSPPISTWVLFCQPQPWSSHSTSRYLSPSF